ncbi:MAG: MFS transporter [Thermomicrobiales bacterium]|nr:MFS transporter [Thermomicrobiales bacterium]
MDAQQHTLDITTDIPLPPAHENALRLILHTPLYRGAVVSLFISGIGGAAITPQISSFLVNEMGASLSVAGMYYLTSLTAPIAGYMVGTRSDRTGQRLVFFRICSFLGFLGWLAFAYAPALWMPFVISATILAVAGAAMGQLFAAIRDHVAAHPSSVGDGVIAYIRMAMTAGWMIGPVIGTTIAAATSTRWVAVFTSVCALLQILPLTAVRTSPQVPLPTQTGLSVQVPTKVTWSQLTPVLIFTALCLNINASETVKYAFLPIFMTDELHLSASLQGIAIGMQPFVELPLIPVAFALSHKVGSMRMAAAAALIAALGNLIFVFADGAFGAIAGQACMGVVWGIMAGLGIIIAQRLLPMAVATASGIYLNTGAIGSAYGGFLGGIGASTLGLPTVFILPAIWCALASVGLYFMSRRIGHHV